MTDIGHHQSTQPVLMKLYRVALRDPSLSRRMVASVHAKDADEALNIVRGTYPWCIDFEVLE